MCAERQSSLSASSPRSHMWPAKGPRAGAGARTKGTWDGGGGDFYLVGAWYYFKKKKKRMEANGKKGWMAKY